MTIKCTSKFLYRSSNIEEKYFEKILKQPLPFDNTEYELRISGTVDTDKRVMSFIDPLWGIEVTGGRDQYEPLTILFVTNKKASYLPVRRSGYAFRAGIRKNDKITRINNTYTDDMTLEEAQHLIRTSGKKLRLFVRGDDNLEECDEFTVDFWFKPRKRFPKVHITNKWPDKFNWNDRKKPVYKESNCFMVSSKQEKHIREVDRKQYRLKHPNEPTEDESNVTTIDESNVKPVPVDATTSEGATEADTTATQTNGVTNGHTNGTHKEEDDKEENVVETHSSNQ